MKSLMIVFGLAAVALAQHQYPQQTTTPVPILKQINRHNNDGSYSFGYEAADGSFKIETKHQNGEVYGKYGYIGDDGKVREVEYGASKQRGFEPAGTDINVPPSTTDEQNYSAIQPLAPGEEDDGQYREDPSVYYTDERYNRPAAPAKQAPAPRPQYYQQPAAQYEEPQDQQYEQPQQYQAQQYQTQQYQAPQQQQQHRFQYQQPRAYYQPQQRQQQRYQAQPQQPGYDINTGSYTVSFTG